MANMRIRIIGDDVLRKPTKPVETFGPELEKLASDMVQSMIAADGIGLAAPQVGLSLKFLVVGMPIDEEDEDMRQIYTFANPEITAEGEELIMREEGCLSIPEIYEEVERPDQITLKYQNLKGEHLEMETSGMLSRVIQHELDHLNGVLFVDHLSPLKRSLLKGKIKRMQQEAEGED